MAQDKNLLKSRFAANFRSYNALAVVQDKICEELAGIMSQHIPSETINKAIEIGAGTGFLTRRMLELYPRAEWTINDLVEESRTFIEPYNEGKNISFIWGDAEKISFPGRADLIATASTVQWFDNTYAFIKEMHNALNPNGWLALTTFGKNNFHEIKTLTGEGLSYYTLEELKKMISDAGFRIISAKEYTKQLLFDTPADVLRHIKATGVNSIRKTRWNKKMLADFEENYRREYSTPENHSGEIKVDAKVSLTYHPIIILAQKLGGDAK